MATKRRRGGEGTVKGATLEAAASERDSPTAAAFSSGCRGVQAGRKDMEG